MPKWKPAPEELVRRFEKAMQSFPEAEQRKVFGYPAAFARGQMFTGLHGESMIIRLPADDRAKLTKDKGAKPFEPMPGRIMGEYMVVPDSVLNSPKQLEAWLLKAFAYAKSLPPKPKRPRKRNS